MNKKAAIGLSVDTIVIIIIGLVILSAGITLLYKFVGGAEDIKTQLDQRTSAEIERLLIDGKQQVVLPLHRATILRGESHVFGLGILNIETGRQNFFLEVTSSSHPDLIINNWLLYDSEAISIDENDFHKESIFVSVPIDAPAGTYIFDAKVRYADEPSKQYGLTQKFIVIVP